VDSGEPPAAATLVMIMAGYAEMLKRLFILTILDAIRRVKMVVDKARQ